MNKIFISGRLTRDPEVRTTSSNTTVASFTLAVDRRFKDASGNRQTDFLPVVAWRQQGEFAGKYLHKGNKVIIIGEVQNRSWDDKDGNKRTVTEVIADEIEFAESKQTGDSAPKQQTAGDSEQPFSQQLATDDTALPFDI